MSEKHKKDWPTLGVIARLEASRRKGRKRESDLRKRTIPKSMII